MPLPVAGRWTAGGVVPASLGVSTGPLGRWTLPRAGVCQGDRSGTEAGVLLFAGGDWAEDHHDVEFQDEQGQVLGTARLPEGVDGVARFHELAASFLPDDGRPGQVMVCIETDRGPWVRALAVAGYRVYAVNPRQAARHRELLSLSGAKSDQADAHTLADMVRTRRHQLRQVAADRTSRATTNLCRSNTRLSS